MTTPKQTKTGKAKTSTGQKPKKTLVGFLADREMHDAMLRLQVRDGIGLSEQVRRALSDWLPKKKVNYAQKEKNR